MATLLDRGSAGIGPSIVESLGPDSQHLLLEIGIPVDLRPGELFARPSDRPSRGGVVMDGLVRVFVMSLDGRRLTVRYARPGAMAGLISGLGARPAPVYVQAVTASRMLELPIDRLRALAEQHVEIAWAIAREVSTRLAETIESVADASFGTLRSRIARHILDLVVENDDDGRPYAVASQQELADSVGTVREVISRLIAQLRDEGLVDTSRRRITIIDADAFATLSGTWRPDALWDPGGSGQVGVLSR